MKVLEITIIIPLQHIFFVLINKDKSVYWQEKEGIMGV